MMRQALLLTLCIASVLLSASPLCALEQPIFDVPRLEKIVIDGKADDWADNGFRVEIVSGRDGVYLPADDLDVAFRLGWDARGLLLLLKVTDDVHVEYPDGEHFWREDCVQLFFAEKRGGKDLIFAFLSPGLDPSYPELRQYLTDKRSNEELKKQPPTIEAARTKTGTGYVMEVLLPWSNLGIEPAVGREVGFQLFVDESDGPDTDFAVRWFPALDTAYYTDQMHRVRLSETPSPPVMATATGRYERFRRTNIAVTGMKELVGKTIAVKMGDVELSKGELTEKDGRASYSIELPMPAHGASYDPLDVLIDDKLIETITLPDAAERRARAFIGARLRFEPAVFSSTRFPSCEFEQPSRVEDLIGRYSITTTFYDKDYDKVKAAEQPGRYGAVVEITTESGRTFRRFNTLYRLSGSPDWFRVWRGEMHATINLPEEYGVDPRVIESQSRIIGDHFKWCAFDDDLSSRDPGFAALLAGLAETDPAAAPAGVTDDVYARDRQWWIGLKRKLYGMDERYPDPFVCPRPIEGNPAPMLREGTATEAGMKPDAVEKIDAVCQAWVAESGEAFAVCLVRNSVVFFHKAYGTRDGEPLTVTTPSWMASITKLMSGTLLMTLVDQGLVELDDTVDEYLPPFQGIEVETPLTIRHLYNHTHGLLDIWGDDMNDLEEVAAGYYPHQSVCKRWEYSGTGLSLGSKIIELISGEVLARFYRNHLLDPLGCTNTEVMGSSGDTFSTPLDMAKIGQMLLNRGAYGDKRFFSEETYKQMLPRTYPDLPGLMPGLEYGVGTSRSAETVALGFGEDCFGHGAASDATFLVDPTHELIIVVTRNRAGEHFEKHKELFIAAVLESLEE